MYWYVIDDVISSSYTTSYIFYLKYFYEYYKIAMSLRVVKLEDVVEFLKVNTRMTMVKANLHLLKGSAIDVVPLNVIVMKDREIEDLRSRIRELENGIGGESREEEVEDESEEEIPMTVITEDISVVERNLGRVGKRYIKFKDGSVVSNYDIILHEGTIPLAWKGILNQDEVIVRRNIRASKDPNKTGKRRSSSSRYYFKKKEEATIVQVK